MNKNEIAENIKYIKDIINSSTEYTDLSGIAAIISGVIAILGSIISLYIKDQNKATLSHAALQLAIIWGIVFLVAIVVNVYFIRHNAKKCGQPVWSRLAKIIVDVLFPALLMGACLTMFFFQQQKIEWIPSMWMGMYGLGIWSASFFSVKPVRYLGMAFIFSSIITLFFVLEYSILMLGVSFGGFHVVYGAWLYYKYGT